MKKNYKKIAISLVVIVVIIAGFLLINKNQNDKINANNKTKNAIKTEGLDKNGGTTAKGNSTTDATGAKGTTSTAGTTGTTGSVNDKTSTGDKVTAEQVKAAEQAKVESAKVGITVFVKAANFGSIADISIDNSKFDSSYKYYQFFLGNKAISKMEAITKIQTNIFPSQEAGTGVTINLMDVNKKVIKKLSTVLNSK
ncbi:MAG TPA: hypothetical protein VIM70_09425 [Clostridium sp.]|uniref:hypothetical protein n=1 Tax=Clostridium sp. TaxID=1506 RepID=UPI002F94346F